MSVSSRIPDVPLGIAGNELILAVNDRFRRLQADETGSSSGQIFTRTLLIKDTAIGKDIADHVTIYADGTAARMVAVLRKAITANLTIVVKLNGSALITATIPKTTAVDKPLTFTGFATRVMADGNVLSAAITASDGSADVDGIASFTFEWRN